MQHVLTCYTQHKCSITMHFHYANCHYAECRYAERRGTLICTKRMTVGSYPKQANRTKPSPSLPTIGFSREYCRDLAIEKRFFIPPKNLRLMASAD